MKFDWSSCAVGLIVGVGAVLCVAFAAQLEIFVETPICADDENGLVCARNWVNALAVVAAAGTIFFLARDQLFNRELAVLQTLEVRALIASVRRIARALAGQAEQIRQFGFRMERDEHVQPGQVRFHIRTLLEAERLLRLDAWQSVTDYDVGMTDERLQELALIADHIRTFLGENEEYVRLHQNLLASEYVQQDWQSVIEPNEFIQLSYRIEGLCADAEQLCEHLIEFRGTAYFRNRGGEARR